MTVKLFNQGKKKLTADWPLIPACSSMEELKKHKEKQVHYESEPNRTVAVPKELADFWCEKYPKTFITDDEANKQANLNAEALKAKESEIDQLKAKVADLEKMLQEASATMSEAIRIEKAKQKLKITAPKAA